MNRTIVTRLAAPLLALCFAGAASAEPNDADAAVAFATCMGNAQMQYLLELERCTPSADQSYLTCKDMAELHYALAKIACSQKPAVVGGATALKALPLRPSRVQSSGKAGATVFRALGSPLSIVRSGGHRR